MYNVITPTYNRAKEIHRVFESLKSQTFKDFKWIIVDDGSTDNTKDVINNWISNESINIEYYHLKKNQGKANAVNFGLEKCTFPYTIIADSDDRFKPNAFLDFYELWQGINKQNKTIASIWTLVFDEHDAIMGDKFPKDFWQVGFKERVLLRDKPIKGDKWTVWRTDVLQKNPLFWNKVCHVQESQTWNHINKQFDFLCVNKAYLNVYRSQGSLMTANKSRKLLNRTDYYNSYYGLRDVKALSIFKYKYYRNLAFNYAKARVAYNDKELKLSTVKLFISFIIFLTLIPKSLSNKLK